VSCPRLERCPATGRLWVDAEGEAARQVQVVEAVVLQVDFGGCVLDLEGLDLDDGLAAAAWHDLVRRVRDTHGRVTVAHAPQMLAHTLYKVGDLQDGRIRLLTPRSDEGTTAG